MTHEEIRYNPTVKETRSLIGSQYYYYKGAMTGKVLWRSWRNKPTDKYDNETVCSIWAEPFVSGEGFSVYARVAIGIYVIGL